MCKVIVQDQELGTCPSCDYSREDFDRQAQVSRHIRMKWEDYAPSLRRTDFGGVYVACENCGFVAVFSGSNPEETVKWWNDLSKKAERAKRAC